MQLVEPTSEIHFPSPQEIVSAFPLSREERDFVSGARRTIQDILDRVDGRRLLIVGPCSIHDLDAAFEYAEKLKKLSERVADQFFIVMRTYFEKPRTIRGWKGMVHDPHLDGSHVMEVGLKNARHVLVELAKMELATGSELLEIATAPYLADLLAWGCVGARTATSQPHRELASALPFPVGFKNTTEGNIDHAIHAILSASLPHSYLSPNQEGRIVQRQSEGNPYCHVILRGGIRGTNFDAPSVAEALVKCRQAETRPKVVVDCSHDNCGKVHTQQIPAFQAVIDQMASENQGVVGAMLESHLFAGNQPITDHLRYGISVTDPCLDWKTTERLIIQAFVKLSGKPIPLS